MSNFDIGGYWNICGNYIYSQHNYLELQYKGQDEFRLIDLTNKSSESFKSLSKYISNKYRSNTISDNELQFYAKYYEICDSLPNNLGNNIVRFDTYKLNRLTFDEIDGESILFIDDKCKLKIKYQPFNHRLIFTSINKYILMNIHDIMNKCNYNICERENISLIFNDITDVDMLILFKYL